MKKKKRRPFWKRGQKQAVAAKAGINPRNFSSIINRKRGCSFDLAKRLETAVKKVTGRNVTWDNWICNTLTDHPAFSPKRRQRRS